MWHAMSGSLAERENRWICSIIFLILAQKGRAIRYARPVQNAVPAEFLNWLEGQELTAKEMVELLGQCSEVGYAAVMCGKLPNNPETVVEDLVKVPTVDLGAYDALFGKGAAAS